jgi:hypothetical protein
MRTVSIFLTTIILVIASCKKDVKISDALNNFKLSEREILADGHSTVSVSVELSDKSSTDRRNVVFSTSSGVFTSSGNNKYTAKAEYENGILVAKSTLKSPTQPGVIKITVQPEFDSPVKEFFLTDSIVAKQSIPASIKLEPSSFGIAANFVNEIFLTATLKNSNGKFVSKRYNVLFEDFVLNSLAIGRFRALSGATTDSSKVTGFYSSSNYPLTTQIKLKGTILDANGLRTSISDSIIISINQ